jgi:hypothetical protein
VAEPTSGNGGNGGWSTREVLIRVDGKVDTLTQTVAAKHAHYDVEVALLKARSDELERSEREVHAELDAVTDKLNALSTRQNIAAGALALIVALSPLIWILVNKLVN